VVVPACPNPSVIRIGGHHCLLPLCLHLSVWNESKDGIDSLPRYMALRGTQGGSPLATPAKDKTKRKASCISPLFTSINFELGGPPTAGFGDCMPLPHPLHLFSRLPPQRYGSAKKKKIDIAYNWHAGLHWSVPARGAVLYTSQSRPCIEHKGPPSTKNMHTKDGHDSRGRNYKAETQLPTFAWASLPI
jgi:hypothetical protein